MCNLHRLLVSNLKEPSIFGAIIQNKGSSVVCCLHQLTHSFPNTGTLDENVVSPPTSPGSQAGWHHVFLPWNLPVYEQNLTSWEAGPQDTAGRTIHRALDSNQNSPTNLQNRSRNLVLKILK